MLSVPVILRIISKTTERTDTINVLLAESTKLHDDYME